MGLKTKLVRAAQAGDTAAFGTLAQNVQRLLFAILHQYRPAADDIEDMAQETLLRAFRNLRRLRDPDRFTAWLTGIAINVVREQRRQAAKHRSVTENAAAGNDPAAAYEKERNDRLLDAVARLPLRYRLPLTLHYLEGLDYRRVAAQLDISEAAARVRVCRARDRLRRDMSR